MKSLVFQITMTSAILVFLASSTQAQELRVELMGSNSYFTDESYDVLSVEDRASFGNWAIGLEVMDHLAILAEYTQGSVKEELFGNIETDFSIYAAQLGAELSYDLTRWLRPHLRVMVGSFWGDLDFDNRPVIYDDTAFGLGVYAMGGYDLLLHIGDPDQQDAVFYDHLVLGLTNSYGYQFGPSFDFDELIPEDSAEGDPRIDMGEVDLAGFTWRLGISVRYLL